MKKRIAYPIIIYWTIIFFTILLIIIRHQHYVFKVSNAVDFFSNFVLRRSMYLSSDEMEVLAASVSMKK